MKNFSVLNRLSTIGCRIRIWTTSEAGGEALEGEVLEVGDTELMIKSSDGSIHVVLSESVLRFSIL